jgi:hypothetical protein
MHNLKKFKMADLYNIYAIQNEGKSIQYVNHSEKAGFHYYKLMTLST